MLTTRLDLTRITDNASRLNVRDDGRRPSEGRDGDGYRFDLGLARTGIFLQMGLDRQEHEPSLICPPGKSARRMGWSSRNPSSS
jgi:hypothetical protein